MNIDAFREGLIQIKTTLKASYDVAPVSARELLRWAQAERRGQTGFPLEVRVRKKLFALSFFLVCLVQPSFGQDAQKNPSTAAHVETLKVVGADINLTLAAGIWALPQSTIIDWVKDDANSVATYYGRFPVPHLELTLTSEPGGNITHGVTYGEERPLIKVGVGEDAAALARDWILVHEMVHLAFPLMDRHQHWIEEGIATYVEPIARAQAGRLSAEKVWGDMLRDMHQGLPQAGDHGLDNTHTWGRTYWGGALFCLVADVRLREQTGNRFGLQHALRAIDRENNGIMVERNILKVLQSGDKATGTHVLTELYNEMAGQPASTDLAALWKKLGVTQVDGKIVFDDSAPLAGVRRAILMPIN